MKVKKDLRERCRSYLYGERNRLINKEVICINSTQTITKGKTYKITSFPYNDTVEIVRDDGRKQQYNANRFALPQDVEMCEKFDIKNMKPVMFAIHYNGENSLLVNEDVNIISYSNEQELKTMIDSEDEGAIEKIKDTKGNVLFKNKPRYILELAGETVELSKESFEALAKSVERIKANA